MVIESGKVKKRSIIKKYFTEEMYIELLKITMIADADNNEKNGLIKDLLIKNNVPFNGLGAGTNRYSVQIDGYAVKFALDDAGKIDNRREMKYTKALQPYVIKVYECTPDGLIAVSEFVEIFNMDDFNTRRQEMAEILEEISQSYLIGDVGITSKNYVNWGKRVDDSICILDFAYIYDVSFNTFKCNCDDEPFLSYDSQYVNLICPACGRKYEFKDIRRRITRKQQENEIGDIRLIGYNIHCDNEIVDRNEKFEPKKETEKTKKKVDEVKELNKLHKRQLKEQKLEANSDYYWD
jgi:hypothetical protein